jgi:hypothetical protein
VGVDLPAVKDYKNLNRKAPRGQRVKSPKSKALAKSTFWLGADINKRLKRLKRLKE